MWITGDVELPDEILDAHERGELVFFVGAGASLSEPSNLPTFNELARRLAQLASHPFSESGGLDFFIGQLESLPQGFDAHFHTHNLISDPTSRFNLLHRAIADLAGVGGAFHVVTTNYDDHLASAVDSGTVTIPDIWHAPALPLGRDFTGLVHLHGSVRRPKEELILTDRDFGHAYITDAWAARFLLPMFDRYTVVFIGYSHDDVIMRYLALGLPSSAKGMASKRFAFTDDPSNSKWGYLGIRPISYPVVGHDHQALVAALTAWASRAKMGQTDHRARVQAIVGGGTALPLPDRDYLRDRIQTTDGANDFAIATRQLPDESKLEWLMWLEDLPKFRALFSPADIPDAAAHLGNWFAGTFVASASLNGAALQTLQRLGQSMTNSLYQTVTRIANDLSKQDMSAGVRWQALLATSIYGQTAPRKSDHLMPFLPDSTARSMPVLRTALRPFLTLQHRWFVDESAAHTTSPDAKVTWNSDDYALTHHVLLVVQESGAGDRSLAGVLEDSIVAAYDLLDAYHGKRDWDPLAYHRSAIEPHAQDALREPLDAVIDGLREYGIKALPHWPDLPDRWWSLDRALMQRLALHLVANDPERSADDKLSWLLDRTGLYASYLKHETYQVLLAAVDAATPSIKQRIMNATGDGPDYREEIPDRDHHLAYAKYNLLAWLTRAAPEWGEAQAAFDAIQTENPDFAVRERPDFDTWMTSGTWGGKPPMDIEEFIQALARDPTDALEELLSHDYSERHFDQPDWLDALGLVRQAAERRPDLGVELWDAVLGRDGLDEKQDDLWRAIAEGWGNAHLGDSGRRAAERLTALLPDADSAYAIGHFLLDQIREQIDTDESPVLESMRELARALWSEQAPGFSHRDSTPLSHAPLYLNSWPGFLAQYWGGEIDRRWRHSREEWAGLSNEESEALVALLNDNQEALDATQTALAGDLFFYFAADPDFAAAHLLPLFNDPQRHVFAWHPFLQHPRWNDRILEAGLFDNIVAELSLLHELPDQTLHSIFLGFVTSVVSYAGITSSDRTRLLDQTVLASDGSHAASFAETVARFLREDGVDGAEAWRQWLGNHLERRVNGQPRVASAEELMCWADVVPAVGEFVPAAVALVSGHSIGLGEHFLDREFPDGALAVYGAELVAFFTERVRSTSSSDYMVKHRVRKLVEAVREAVGDTVAQPLVEAATVKGYLAAQ